MPMSSKVGSITVPAATGNQAYTGLGFQPKAVVFWANFRSSDGTSSSSNNAEFCYFFGMATDSTHRGVSISADDWSATSQSVDATKCIRNNTVGGTASYAADLVSMDADGFTLNWTTANGTAYVVNYLALGGSSLTNATVISKNAPNATGNDAWTGAGFQPDAILLIGNKATADAGRFSSIGIGAASGTTARWAINNCYDNTTDQSYQVSTKVVAWGDQNNAATVDAEADLVSFGADGFTIDWTAVPAITNYWTDFALCLKGGNYKAGTFAGNTTTGNQGVTGVGFKPTGVLFASFGRTASAALVSGAPMNLSIGAASGSTERAVMAQGEGSAQASTSLDRTKCLKFLTDSTTTVLNAQDFVSFDADGFTVNVTTADAVARDIAYMAFGPAAAGVDLSVGTIGEPVVGGSTF